MSFLGLGPQGKWCDYDCFVGCYYTSLKWGKLLSNRWLMILTVFSNIVTVWSWKGTNMLGIGLHSYGFTEKTFYWLMIFFITQIAIMFLAMIPLKFWVSFSNYER